MSEVRGKPERTPAQLPAPRPRTQIPSSLGPRPAGTLATRLPAPLARLTKGQERASAAHRFDKAFPVFLESVRGVANGVGRNISAEGMFVETRDPLPMGTQVRVVFGSQETGVEICAIAEVRFQCFLNFAGSDGEQDGLRGMGLRFLRFEEGGLAPAARDAAH